MLAKTRGNPSPDPARSAAGDGQICRCRAAAAIPLPGVCLGDVSTGAHGHRCTDAHRNIIQNSRDVKPSKMPNNPDMTAQRNVVEP